MIRIQIWNINGPIHKWVSTRPVILRVYTLSVSEIEHVLLSPTYDIISHHIT